MVVNSRMTTRYLAKLPVYCTVCIELALLLGWGSEKSQVYILTIYTILIPKSNVFFCQKDLIIMMRAVREEKIYCQNSKL